MRKKLQIVFILIFALQLSVNAQEQIKAMFYNVLNFPIQAPVSRVEDHLSVIIDDYRPDLFMICELNNETGANLILDMMQGINLNYQRATFVTNTSDDTTGNQNDLQNMIFFDATKFSLLSQTEVTTNVRDFNHYIVRLKTVNEDTNPIILNVFVTHLKSSNGTANQNVRFQQVLEFTDYLNTLSPDSYVILGADLNFYTASENGFQELVDGTNNITLADPADRVGSWSNNANFLDVFTQSTRTQNGLGGATGGFDDRFDFIMTSENLLDNNEDIYYVDGSYRAYGNNNNSDCYNDDINDPECAGADYNFAIRDALYFMSDHLPVTVTLETTETLSLPDAVSQRFEIIGGTIIDDELQISNPKALGDFSIFNTIGQNMINFSMYGELTKKVNVSKLSKGIYYIVDKSKPNFALKFIKN